MEHDRECPLLNTPLRVIKYVNPNIHTQIPAKDCMQLPVDIPLNLCVV